MTFTLLPASSMAPSLARQTLVEDVHGDLPQERLDDATLLVSEIVTNAVRHAGLHASDRISVSVRHDDGYVVIEVADPGSGFPEGVQTADRATGGWGLLLLDRLSDGWGIDEGPGGRTVVWFRVALHERT
jgi:anti-sigma regulatory factor (Ser/Thr protein kinase)